MKIIFFGTPSFAANNLQYLIDKKYKIVAAITPPDSKKGRGKQIKACPVKEVAIRNKIPVLQPDKLRSDNFINELKEINAELFVVVAFRMLPEIIWKMPKRGTINLHTSLLPNYKGAAPINWVLINGERETGISTFYIDNKIDSGAIIKQERIELSEKNTAAELHNILIDKGNSLLVKTLDLLKNNYAINAQTQYSETIHEAPKLTKELLKINWNKSPTDIHNLVRGLSPYINNSTSLKDVSICPSAWFLLEKNGIQKRIKVHLTKVINLEKNDNLTIKSDKKTYLHIKTTNGEIAILHLQAEGKNPMSIQQFLQGTKITEQHKIV